MKPFEKWLSDFTIPEIKEAANDGGQDLPENVSGEHGNYKALCCCCEQWKPLYCDIKDVPAEGYKHYCGGSDRCCP